MEENWTSERENGAPTFDHDIAIDGHDGGASAGGISQTVRVEVLPCGRRSFGFVAVSSWFALTLLNFLPSGCTIRGAFHVFFFLLEHNFLFVIK